MIFDKELYGHHLEYIHYLYTSVINRNNNDDDYIFVIPNKGFKKVSAQLYWGKSSKVSFRFLSDDEVGEIKGNQLMRCFKESKLIRKIQIEINADEILLINIAGVIPILPLLVPNNIKISGIIYQIYLYNQNTSILKKILDKIRYYILAHNKSINHAFILNDSYGAKKLNQIYFSKNFTYLPDPVPQKDKYKITNLREILGISDKQNIFLHFGAMSKRKGTIEILKAISILPLDFKATFIFAGIIDKEIVDEFNSVLEILHAQNRNIIVKNEFCTYDYIHSLCHTCDCILIPYHATNLSSGVLGYCAIHNKMAIGPSSGLIGRLISEYQLGIMLDSITPQNIAKAIIGFSRKKIPTKYVYKNTAAAFTDMFLG